MTRPAACRPFPYRMAGAFAVAVLMSGCGTQVPSLHEPWEEADIDDNLALRIHASIYCELRLAVAELGRKQVYENNVLTDSLPDDWGAQTTLQLQIDETGGFNPSGSWTPHPTFSLPITTQLSSQATRIEKYYSFFPLKQMKKPVFIGDDSCVNVKTNEGPLDRHGSNLLLSGNLGIRNWLKNALELRTLGGGSALPKRDATKSDVLSYDVKFIVITTATANPSLKEVRFLTGNGTPLFSANRTRTNDLLLTLGPSVERKAGKGTVVGPSDTAFSLHANGEFGQVLSGALASGGGMGQQPTFRLPF